MTIERIDKLLSNRGYCSRSDARAFLRENEVLDGDILIKNSSQRVRSDLVTISGEALDPGMGVVLVMHKPRGYTCSHREDGPLVYELLPPRYAVRNPPLSTVGRLDKETTGVLLITDHGELLHRLTSPRHGVEKKYFVELLHPLRGTEADLFSSGTFTLPEEDEPLRPAVWQTRNERTGYLLLHEGRYHQIRRMFAAIENQVIKLERVSYGSFTLAGIEEEGSYRTLSPEEIEELAREVKIVLTSPA